MAKTKITADQLNSYAFFAYLPSNQTITGNNTDNLVNLTSTLYNNGSVFDTTNKRFVAPVAGIYHFDFMIHAGTSGTYDNEIRIYKNGSVYSYGARANAANGGFTTVHQGMDMQLAAGDQVSLYAQQSTATSLQGSFPYTTYMSGFMVAGA